MKFELGSFKGMPKTTKINISFKKIGPIRFVQMTFLHLTFKIVVTTYSKT